MTDSGQRPRKRRAGAARDLSDQQQRILVEIRRYVDATGEPCSHRYLARRLQVHHSTIQEHLERLHRKGWIRSPHSPVRPK